MLSVFVCLYSSCQFHISSTGSGTQQLAHIHIIYEYKYEFEEFEYVCLF